MDRKITDEMLIAMIEGESNPELEEIIKEDKDLQARYEELRELLMIIGGSTTPEVPAYISESLQEAISKEKNASSNQNMTHWYQIAASVAILLVGFGVGKWSSDGISADEYIALQQEVQSLNNKKMISYLQQHTASERIMAVNKIEDTSEANPDLIATLLGTLNNDESASVRYAAMQALKKYTDDQTVRAGLVKSLELQQDPLIQISLISILLEISEKSAIGPIKELIEEEGTTPEVKEQARVALKILV